MIILGLYFFCCINFLISILYESAVVSVDTFCRFYLSVVSVHSCAAFCFHFFYFAVFFLYTFSKFCQLVTYLLLFYSVFPEFFRFCIIIYLLSSSSSLHFGFFPLQIHGKTCSQLSSAL